MNTASCHATVVSPRDRAKQVILKELGVRRVADWCGKSEAAVYQWLSRGSDDEPIPAGQIPAIIEGARKAGILVDAAVIWPALARAQAGEAETVSPPDAEGVRA